MHLFLLLNKQKLHRHQQPSCLIADYDDENCVFSCICQEGSLIETVNSNPATNFMQSALIVDLVIKEAEISPNLTGLKFPLWLIIRADGSQQPFSTPEADDLKHPVWNYPARICVSLGHNDLPKAYLYVTLCTFGDGRIGIKPLGRARVSLKSLPIGDAKSFFFPLMMQNDLNREACIVKFAATISFFSPQGGQFRVFSQKPIDRYFPK